MRNIELKILFLSRMGGLANVLDVSMSRGLKEIYSREGRESVIHVTGLIKKI